MKILWKFAAVLGFCTVAALANAELLGIDPGLPSTSGVNPDGTAYDGGGQVTLTINATTTTFGTGRRDRKPHSSDSVLTISFQVDGAGNVIGGVPGPDLIMTGTINGGYTDPLLEGEILDFGFFNATGGFATDTFDFRFQLTGGSLAADYGSNDIGAVILLEDSGFDGSFAVAWSTGDIKLAEMGPIPPLECTGTIGDFVWRDDNRDGIQDSGEPGIGNVLVELLDSTGAFIATNRTLANGEYEFTGLCAGVYTVRISSTDPDDTDVALDGLDPTLLGQGTDATDSNDHDGTLVNLPTDDSNNDTIDFGYKPPVLGMIGDFVWEDTNGNGIQDANEDGIQGITVNLYKCSDDLNTIDSTSTLSDGSYKFNDVAAGSYFVEFNAGTNYRFSPANEGDDDKVDSDASTATTDTQIKRTGCFSFDPADWPDGFDDTRDAGLYLPVSLGDFVWDDLNENGQQDPGELGVNSVTATLSRFNDCNYPNQGTTLAGSTETATGTPLDNGGTPADGYYSFTGLQPGCYKVTFSFNQTDYPGYVFTAADQDSDLTDSDADPANGMTGLITLDSGDSDPTIDAGIYQPDTAQLGNFIWLDLNADGFQANDDGIEGARAQLYSCDANGNPDAPVAGVAEQTTSLADGSYLFDNLPSGSYAVKFTVPTDAYMFSPANQGNDDAVDSDAAFDINGDPIDPIDMSATMLFSHCVTLDVADENLRVNLTVDAGVFQKASIGDFVWFDEDRDGIQDLGESGLGLDDGGNPIGVTVNLYTCTGTTRDANVFASTSADATTGSYEFTDLDPGDYAVEFVSPDGFVFSPQDQGGDDATDSDADSSGSAACTNLVSGENDPTWDAGLNKPAQAALEIIKKTNDTDNNEPTGPYITVSDTVTWTYIVTNMGTEDLSNLVLTDDSGTPADPNDPNDPALNDDVIVNCYSDPNFDPDTSPPSSDLPMDGTLYCELINSDPGATAGQYGNIGEVCGEYEEYNEELMQFETVEICASDPDYYFGGTPSIDIRKQAEGPDSRQVESGSDVDFTIVVTNNGELPLESIAISDFTNPDLGLDVSDCLRMFNELPPALEPGGFHEFTCTIPDVTDDFVNTACADANVEGKAAVPPYIVEDCDPSGITVVVLPAAIDISKQAEGSDSRDVVRGSDVTFAITVTNTGQVPLQNVSVTDVLGPDCARPYTDNGGILDVDAVWSYDCVIADAQANYTNTAEVEGFSEPGERVDDSDPSSVMVLTPLIDISKQAEGSDSRDVVRGSDVTFAITVTNTGQVPLQNVSVTDVLGPDCARPYTDNGGILDVDAVWSYDCVIADAQANYTNTAEVEGFSEPGERVDDSDPSSVMVLTPLIDISKQAEGSDSRDVVRGSDVTFAITVTNTGQVPLQNVSVTDVLGPDCARPYTDNGGILDVDAVWSYDCVIADAQANYTNTAEVEGFSEPGERVDDSDPSSVMVLTPLIDISKQAEGSDSRDVVRGSDVTFAITVTNTGQVPLQNVSVTDVLGPDCARPYTDNGGILDVDAVWSYDCVIADAQANYTNTAEVEGFSESNERVDDSDPSSVMVLTPLIDISKQAEGSDSRDVVRGSDVTFAITVTNTGDVPLQDVSVTDVLGPDCARPYTDNGGILDVDAVWSYECVIADAQANYTNTAEVEGFSESNERVDDSDPSSVVVRTPAIDIEKATNGEDADVMTGPTIPLGGAVTWTYLVINTGEVPLTNISVVDTNTLGDTVTPLFTSSTGNLDNVLEVGETWTYEATGVAAAGQYMNKGKVTGTPADANGDPLNLPTVMDTDDSHYIGAVPAINIRKQSEDVNGVPTAADDIRVFEDGSDVSFNIVVENTGAVDLIGVTVDDDLVATCDPSIDASFNLAIGQDRSFSCTTTNVTNSFVNEACVTGNTANGVEVGDCDKSDVEIIDIDIIKRATDGSDTQTTTPGGPATFDIVVTNTGDETLFDVAVTDVLGAACNRDKDDIPGLAELAPNASVSYSCAVFEIIDTFENEACVAGSRGGVTVEDCDPSTVVVAEVCDLTLDKMCFVPPPPPSSEFFCDKPIDSLTMIWTEPYTVWVEAWKGPVGSESLGVQSVAQGEEITFTGYAGSPNDVFWVIYADEDLTMQIGESKFHLSCSDGDMDGETDTSAFPNDCGKPQGNGKDNDSSLLNLWQLEGMVDANNTLDCTVDDTPTYLQACEFTPDPAPSCETTGNPDTLTWRYDGGTLDGSCENSTFNVQGDFQDSCIGSVTVGETITVVDDNGNVYSVDLNGEFTMALDDAKSISLSNNGGTQSFNLHTSCSQPIEAGLTAGALTLVALDGQRADREVEYAYAVTNLSSGTVTDITISDDQLTVPGSITSLAPGESDTLTASAFLETTLTNTATASGFLSATACVSNEDSVTVTAEIPPCDIGIYVYDISDDALKLKLTNNDSRNRIATLEEIMITYPRRRSAIREIKLDGAIYKRDDSDETFMSPATIGEDDWTEADVTKRQLDPGETRTLEVKTYRKTDKEDAVFEVTLKFNEDCEYTFEIDYSDKGTTVQIP